MACPIMKYCKICQNETKCQICDNNFVVQDDGSCKSCLEEHCVECDTDGNCIICEDNWYLPQNEKKCKNLKKNQKKVENRFFL